MTDKKPFLNTEMLNATQLSPKKAPKEKKNKKEKTSNLKEVNTRNIRFSKRRISNLLSVSFFTVFILLAIVAILFFGRVDTLTKIAVSKQVNPDDIIQKVYKEEEKTDQVVYEAKSFLETLLTMKPGEEWRKAREEKLKSGLSKNMTLNEIETLQSNVERSIDSIYFMEKTQKEVGSLGKVYYLTFDVNFTENGKGYNTQMILPVSYAERDLRLVNVPTYTNLTRSANDKKNPANYKPSAFYTEGEVLSESEHKKVQEFINQFFKLYVVNDPNLKLISNVQGLEQATLDQLTLKNYVRGENGTIYVEGTIQFHYEESSRWNSFFKMELKQNKDSYFVTKFNGQ
ncbi:putative uncharacterized domain protein [Carnobacterium maltaromaticum LMA28]|uniref:Uncharacterized domain protein n=1 Tax=Carnobacterium maltaromaticum LMA28 TaxID=1234679 RepID=K8E580_CARML|nr:conjugal transfer protein [Carnobacterium maltaromaticum]CCO11795.2 putative uncharacterized domain protein [Carnobacterium maltaromaticum LMA28]